MADFARPPQTHRPTRKRRREDEESSWNDAASERPIDQLRSSGCPVSGLSAAASFQVEDRMSSRGVRGPWPDRASGCLAGPRWSAREQERGWVTKT